MQKAKITTLDYGRFAVQWNIKGQEQFSLNLNFNPIIANYNLEKKGILLHWQARPKMIRRWGVFDLATGEYVCSKGKDIVIIDSSCRLLDVDERLVASIPTACIYFPTASIDSIQNENKE